MRRQRIDVVAVALVEEDEELKLTFLMSILFLFTVNV